MPLQELPKQTTKPFKTYPPGNIHIDITQVYTKKEKLYLLVAKDHTTKYCIAKPYKDQTRATAIEFLQKVIKDYPLFAYSALVLGSTWGNPWASVTLAGVTATCKDPQTYPKDKTYKTAYVPGKKTQHLKRRISLQASQMLGIIIGL